LVAVVAARLVAAVVAITDHGERQAAKLSRETVRTSLFAGVIAKQFGGDMSGLAHGGRGDGPVRPRLCALYAAFPRDPDGNKIEVVLDVSRLCASWLCWGALKVDVQLLSRHAL